MRNLTLRGMATGIRCPTGVTAVPSSPKVRTVDVLYSMSTWVEDVTRLTREFTRNGGSHKRMNRQGIRVDCNHFNGLSFTNGTAMEAILEEQKSVFSCELKIEHLAR